MATAAKKKTTKKTTKKATKSRARTLLVVESPSKAKIIGKYLGSSYKVIASVGHVRDLPKSRLAVNVDTISSRSTSTSGARARPFGN